MKQYSSIQRYMQQAEPREARRILVGRYEIAQSAIYVLRLWHSREER